MREIKFRVWDKKENEMYDWDKIIHFDQETMCMMTILSEAPNDNDWVWSQFTGLNDKNNKEIYEGDILKITCKFELRKGIEVDVVDWADNCYGFGCSDWNLFELANNQKKGKQEFEVIGNIYENPELLQ